MNTSKSVSSNLTCVFSTYLQEFPLIQIFVGNLVATLVCFRPVEVEFCPERPRISPSVINLSDRYVDSLGSIASFGFSRILSFPCYFIYRVRCRVS